MVCVPQFLPALPVARGDLCAESGLGRLQKGTRKPRLGSSMNADSYAHTRAVINPKIRCRGIPDVIRPCPGRCEWVGHVRLWIKDGVPASSMPPLER
jgi:hypothetical protein